MSAPNIAFLFGSGISINAGLPSSDTIMSELMAGKATRQPAITDNDNGRFIFHAGDEKYRIGQLPSQGLLVDHRIIMFLRCLRWEADNYFFGRKPTRPPNYEDLFYMIWEVLGSKSGHVENPAANALIRQLDREFAMFYTDAKGETLSEGGYLEKQNGRNRLRITNVGELAQKTYNYVQGYLCAALSIANPNLEGFGWIKDAIDDGRDGRKLFFTLNHDLLLENFFESRKIDYTDGFSSASETDGGRYWQGEGLDNAKAPLLAKLHGSINWFCSDSKIVSTPIDGPSRSRTHEGPLILIGRDNKPKDYAKPIFQELHSQFYCRLKELNRLIVCGYGFGDDVINMRLQTWLFKPENRLVLVHPESDECLNRVSPYFRRQLNDSKSQYCFVRSTMEKVEWGDISKKLT